MNENRDGSEGDDKMKLTKHALLLILCLCTIMALVGCAASASTAEYTTAEFEEALNAGEKLDGKTVSFTVDAIEPASAFGFNLQTGEHLNFVSSDNPGVEVGDELIVKVDTVQSVIGSFIITYEILE